MSEPFVQGGAVPVGPGPGHETWARSEGRGTDPRGYERVSPAPPTQTAHPWRATIRTIAAATVGLLSLLPYALADVNVPTEGLVAQALAFMAAVTRVLALPQVNAWVTEWAPWLAPTPRR